MKPQTRAGAINSEWAINQEWRVGRSVGRTIYAMSPGEHSALFAGPDEMRARDDSYLIGVMDTPEIAAVVVEAHNAARPLFREPDLDASLRGGS